MKSSSVRGTPVRSSGGSEGQMAGKPAAMTGTSPSQYVGDQSQQPQRGSGTPYNSANGNSANAKRVASSGLFGEVIDTQTGVNLSRPDSNGNGVLFDGISRESDYSPQSAVALDSPVPAGSPVLARGAMRRENLEHLGQGAAASLAGDVLTDIGGVMSRGMVGTTGPNEPEDALTRDDTL